MFMQLQQLCGVLLKGTFICRLQGSRDPWSQALTADKPDYLLHQQNEKALNNVCDVWTSSSMLDVQVVNRGGVHNLTLLWGSGRVRLDSKTDHGEHLHWRGKAGRPGRGEAPVLPLQAWNAWASS